MQITEETQKIKQHFSIQRRVVLTGAAVAVACTLFFFSLYWNRFSGLRSGNGSFQAGIALLSGLRPYRDFYTAGPPFNMILSGAALRLFGPYLIVIRALGVFERLILAALLYTWLTRFFRPQHAAIASILAVVVSTGDPSNNLSSYGFEAILFFMLSAFAATLALDRTHLSKSFTCWALVAGAFAALSFETKQTTGIGATLAIPFMSALYLFWAKRGRKALYFLACFGFGWCIVAGAIFLWLVKIGAFREFLIDAFQKGPSAKAAHLSDFVIRALRAAWYVLGGFIVACVLLVLNWPAMRKAATDSDTSLATSSGRILWIGVLSFAAIGCAAALSYRGITLFTSVTDLAIYVSSFGAAAFAIFVSWRLLRGTLSDRQAKIGFLAGSCLVIAFMVSLSWPASFDMVFPGLGLVVAAILDGSRPWQRAITYAVCGLLLFSATSGKLHWPHGFHDWFDPPVREATAASNLPQLAGLRLPPSEVTLIDRTIDIISQYTKPSDTIFCYPEFGVFYPLAHRGFPTQTDSHNIDVVNDAFARAEAQRVLQKRPAVLIYYRIPAWSLRADETLWRGGKPSGQRDLINAMETLAKQYRLAGTFAVPPNPAPVQVYVRQ